MRYFKRLVLKGLLIVGIGALLKKMFPDLAARAWECASKHTTPEFEGTTHPITDTKKHHRTAHRIHAHKN